MGSEMCIRDRSGAGAGLSAEDLGRLLQWQAHPLLLAFALEADAEDMAERVRNLAYAAMSSAHGFASLDAFTRQPEIHLLADEFSGLVEFVTNLRLPDGPSMTRH